MTPEYKSKQISYDLAHEISQKAKKILGLSQYDVETLEHDINNLRAHEWLDLFDMIPDSNEVKKLYFTHCVELEDEAKQQLEEDMKYKETNKQDTTSKLTIDFILFTDLVFDTYQDSGDNYQAAIDRAQDIFPNIEFRKDDPDFEHITLYGNRRQIEKFLNFYNYGDNWKSRIKDNYKQELEESMNILTTVRTRLNRLCSPYQAQVWDNGRFEVHQVKEDDKDRLVNSLRRISKEVHATANGKYDFSKPAMFGGIHSQYYNIYGEIEMEDKNESLQLTEGHDVQEYKGFELDLDTDLTNHNWEDEEYVITPTVEIKYNGKVLATANGYRKAREWVDKHAEIREFTREEKLDILANILSKDKNLNVWLEDYGFLCIDQRDLMDESYGISDFTVVADTNGYHFGIRSKNLVDTLLSNHGITTEVMEKELGYENLDVTADEMKFDYLMCTDLFTPTFNDIAKLI